MDADTIAAINQLALSLGCGECSTMPGGRCRNPSSGRVLALGKFHKGRVDPLIKAYTLGLAAASQERKVKA